MNFDDVLMKYKYAEAKKFIEAFSYYIRLPRRLLDIGCGDGQFLYLVGKDLKAFELHGIDVDFEKLKIADCHPEASYHYAEFEEWDTDLQFGYITAFNVLEHIEDDHEFLLHCHRLLHKGGRLIVTVPNAMAFHKRIGKLMGLTKPYQLTQSDLEKGHKRNYDIGYLTGIVGNAGFNIIRQDGIFFKPLPSEMLMEHYDPKLFDALYEMGKDFPDMCSSIMIVGEKR